MSYSIAHTAQYIEEIGPVNIEHQGRIDVIRSKTSDPELRNALASANEALLLATARLGLAVQIARELRDKERAARAKSEEATQ